MSNNENTPPTPSSPTARRASFAPGQKLSEFFGRQPTNNNNSASGTSAYPGPISQAAAQANQRRRMSITTLGLSGSPNQSSPPYGVLRPRHNSASTNGETSPGAPADESAIDDSGDGSPPSTSPFGRRLSFGAKAMRDVRGGSGTFNGRASISAASSQRAQRGPKLSSSPDEREEDASPSKSNFMSRNTGEGGFNWSDSMRTRAERSSSISGFFGGGGSGSGPNSGSPPSAAAHHKAPSVSSMEQPVKEVPKTPRAPDHFQERILKGDFYMD